MRESYYCWRCALRIAKHIGNNTALDRIDKKELIVRKENSKHIHYVCPKCESVIICKRYD
jgi:hypothetical protein